MTCARGCELGRLRQSARELIRQAGGKSSRRAARHRRSMPDDLLDEVTAAGRDGGTAGCAASGRFLDCAQE